MVIGIDYGARRIGVAVSESGVVATPHSVIRNEPAVTDKIARLGEDLGADQFVVGIARRPGSSERRFHDFAAELRQKTCKPVVLWDEALSTVEATEALRASGRGRREAQREIDMHAAAVILQSWLDDRARRGTP
jgi:putative Holliday junction resolvase